MSTASAWRRAAGDDPSQRLATMPEGLPELTLGWGVIKHAVKYFRHPNGPRVGQRWRFVDSQIRFLLWWYAVDEYGNWLFHRGVRRLPKGSGKSPFAGLLALEEFVGPVRLADFDPRVPGGCVGRPVSMPLVQIAATSESQTENTMRMVRALAPKRSRLVVDYNLDPGKTQYYRQPEGTLKVITSSAASAEGGEATFIVGDETEHWTPGRGGPELMNTLLDNLAKSGSRMMETCNSWRPDRGTVAESSWDAWVLQEEGRVRGDSRILYDARIAPPDTVLTDERSLRRALDWVYDDCWWVNRDALITRIWDPGSDPSDSERKYLNRPSDAKDAWIKAAQWDRCADPKESLKQGDQVALAADLSKSGDATAVIACRISDGHIFTWDVWDPDPEDTDWEVPRHELDASIGRAFDQLDVVAFYAEPGPLLSYVDKWGEQYGDRLCARASAKNPVRFDMRSTQDGRAKPVLRRFVEAAQSAHAAIIARDLAHDGDKRLRRHVLNARRRPSDYGVGIGKSSKDSPDKVDAAVTMVISRIARQDYLALPEARRRKPAADRRVVVFRGGRGRPKLRRAGR